MGFRDVFQDNPVIIKVVDSANPEIDYFYWIRGKIESESNEFLVIKNAVIGTESYRIYMAKEVVINKSFIEKIEDSKENDVERKILRLYHKNRVGLLTGFVFLMFGIGSGMIAMSIYLSFFT